MVVANKMRSNGEGMPDLGDGENSSKVDGEIHLCCGFN